MAELNPKPNKKSAFLDSAKSRLSLWVLSTIDPILFIIHVSLIYIVFLLSDTLILAIIGWSFGDVITQSIFAQKLLEGIKLLSALGTAAAYGLHLIYSLYQEARHVAKVIRKTSNKKEIIK